MNREFIATAKTIEEAIELGCAELGCSREEAEVEVIEAPSRSLFGLKTTNARVRVSVPSGPSDRAAAFLKEVLTIMGVEAEPVTRVEEDRILVDLQGPDMGIVIGRRGETLDALQYLTSLVVNREEQNYVKVTVDTENYRAKREETLVRLARKLASKVVKYHRSMSLEPMNPYERRIIHATLQEFEGVTTSSTGVEPNRKVVISPEGEPERSAREDRPGRRGGRDRAPRRREERPERPAPAPKEEHHVSDKDLWAVLNKNEE